MILALATLVLAGLSSAQDDRQARARQQQLRGRLGVMAFRRQVDLFSRLVGILQHEVRAGDEQLMVWVLLQQLLDDVKLGNGPPPSDLDLFTGVKRERDRSSLSDHGEEVAYRRRNAAFSRLHVAYRRRNAAFSRLHEGPDQDAHPRAQERKADLQQVRLQEWNDLLAAHRQHYNAIQTTMPYDPQRWRVPEDSFWLVSRGGAPHRLTPLLSWVIRQYVQAYRSTTPEADQTFISMHDSLKETLPSMLDWVADENIDLGRYTWTQAKVASDVWHEQFFSEADFGEPVADAVLVARFPDGRTWHRLVTSKQLVNEGLSMDHCVGRGRHWQRVRDNKAAIYSLRGSNQVPMLTIELVEDGDGLHRHLHQAMKPHDVPVVGGDPLKPYIQWLQGVMGVTFEDEDVLDDALRSLTVDRGRGDAPEGLYSEKAARDRYPQISHRGRDTLRAWWTMDEAAYQLSSALFDHTHAHGDRTQEEFEEWVADYGEDQHTDMTFDEWVVDQQETTTLWVQDAWGVFQGALEAEAEDLAAVLDLTLDPRRDVISSQSPTIIWWDLDSEDGATVATIGVRVHDYDGNMSFFIEERGNPGRGIEATSDRGLLDAALEFGLLEFKADRDAKRAAFTGEMLLVDSLVQGHLGALAAARAAGQPMDPDMRRQLRRGEGS